MGNELLADDAFGPLVAERFQQFAGASIVCTSASGFDLLDHVLDVSDLLVVDTIQTGAAEVGTVHIFHEKDLEAAWGSSPHYVGLLETLALARRLRLSVPKQVVMVAVEAADTSTIGGAMHPAVRAAVPSMVNLIRRFLDAPLSTSARAGMATGGRSRCG